MPDPLRYTVDLTARAHHLVTVRLEIPGDVAGPVRLEMPTWTPGSYMMRDYVHHVQQLEARGAEGDAVAVHAVGHTGWELATAGPVTVTWELYANDLTVRTNHVDDHHALLVPPATFVTVEGCRDREHRVSFPTASRVHGMLPTEGDDHVAADLDLLVDTAFEVPGRSDFPVATVVAEDVEHRFVWAGHGPGPDLDEVAATMGAVARATRELLGTPLPLDRYTFLCEGWDGTAAGGLEHRDGAVLMAPLATLHTADGRARFQGLLAHEYLHLANVKRMVPAELVRPSLTRHVHTRSLWVAEGWTAYYDDLLAVRAGLWDVDRFLQERSDLVARVLRRPGARRQSVAEASWTAWTKLYVRDENWANAGTDYYAHGALLAWCLDLLVRRERPGSDGLDDAFRLLWQEFGDTSPRVPTRGYAPDDVVAAVSSAAGADLSGFFQRHVDGTEAPPVRDLVEIVGLDLVARLDDEAPPSLGIETTDDDHGVTVASVHRDRPAWEAGITGGDRLLAIDGIKVEPRRLDALLRMHGPGDLVDVTVFSGPRLRTLPVRLAAPVPDLRLEPRPDATAGQRAAFEAWTGRPLPAPGDR